MKHVHSTKLTAAYAVALSASFSSVDAFSSPQRTSTSSSSRLRPVPTRAGASFEPAFDAFADDAPCADAAAGATATPPDVARDAGANGARGPLDAVLAPTPLDPTVVSDAIVGGRTAPSALAAVDERANDGIVISGLIVEGRRPATSKEDDVEFTLRAVVGQDCAVDDSEHESLPIQNDELNQIRLQAAMIESHFDDAPATRVVEPVTAQVGTHGSAQGSTPRSLLADAPSVAKILRYTLPAIGIWLCSPVLSMIDTAAVGLLSGTAQQAALNPAVSIADYSALLAAFMYTATTNLIAAAVREDQDAATDGGGPAARPRTTATLVTALQLALAVGAVLGAVLGLSAEALLRRLIGNAALDPAVYAAALRYVRVRALGMPAMVAIGTAQSASLGMRDVRAPLYVLAAAAAINFVGDAMLVPRAGSALFGGAAGAAWATVASQYAALLFFARWMTAPVRSRSWRTDGAASSDAHSGAETVDERAKVVNVTKGTLELTTSTKVGRSRRRNFRRFLVSSKLADRVRRTTGKVETFQSKPESASAAGPTPKEPSEMRGFLSGGKLTLRSYFSLSNLDKTKAGEFLPFVVPVTTTAIGRISGYIAMSHVASSALGTYDMAAHQIVFSIFCCLTPFVDALNQVAQSFVPAVFEAQRRDEDRARALRRTVGNFRTVGAGFGAVLVGLAACIPRISGGFTTDAAVRRTVEGALPGVGAFLLVNGLMCAGEGCLLGQRDLGFLRNAYAAFFFLVPAYMLRLKYRALAGVQQVGVGTMWAAFGAYNIVRAGLWHLRLAQLQRRTDSEVEEVAIGS